MRYTFRIFRPLQINHVCDSFHPHGRDQSAPPLLRGSPLWVFASQSRKEHTSEHATAARQKPLAWSASERGRCATEAMCLYRMDPERSWDESAYAGPTISLLHGHGVHSRKKGGSANIAAWPHNVICDITE